MRAQLFFKERKTKNYPILRARVEEEIFNGKHERRKEGFRESICPTEMIEKYFIEQQNHYWQGASTLH